MPDPVVLGFDTSAAHCAAAVVRGDAVLASRDEPLVKGQAERLFPLLDDLLAEAGVGWADLAAIGVGTGPGNFTGIRISVAAARGLALSLGVPAIGVGVTEALALDLPRPCRVAISARGDDVIWQDFGPTAMDPAAMASAAVGDKGGAALSHRDALPPGLAFATPRYPLAVAIARIARSRIGTVQPRPAPIYLRPADAAPPRDPPPVILP